MILQYCYEQAAFALKICESKKGNTLLFYESCQSEHILKLLAQSADLRSLCHPEIHGLWGNDNNSKREWVRCLYAYLVNGKNITDASKYLDIHRNTVIYRLDKISSILGVDVHTINKDKSFFYLISSKPHGGRIEIK